MGLFSWAARVWHDMTGREREDDDDDDDDDGEEFTYGVALKSQLPAF